MGEIKQIIEDVAGLEGLSEKEFIDFVKSIDSRLRQDQSLSSTSDERPGRQC